MSLLQRLLRSSVVFLFAGICAPFCWAAPHTQSWEKERFAADAAALYKAASDVKVPPGSNVAVLVKEYRVEFDATGKKKHTLYWVYKIENKDGVEGWDSAGASWEPWHENRPAIRARVITANTEIHELDPKTITEVSPDKRQGGEYTDRKTLTAPLPAVGPGSVVEEEDVWAETKPLFVAGAIDAFEFGTVGVPIAHCRLILSAPASVSVNYELQKLPGLKPEMHEANGVVETVFDESDLSPLQEADQYLPSDVPAYPAIYFSTGTSWKAMADAYGKIVDEQIAKSDVNDVTKKAIAGKAGREDKITGILQYVDNEVRYTGVEFGDAAIVPGTPAETLKRKYGDCKDKSTLFVAMLRAAGIPAYVALLRVGDRQDAPRNLPGMGVFDHAIVYVPGTPDYWIDATDTDARLGELATVDQGRLTLIARADADSLITTPVTKSEDNLQLEERNIYLADNGPARVVEITRPHGSLESFYRDDYRDTQNKDVRKRLTDYFGSEYLAEKLDRFETSGGDDITKQFSMTLESKSAKRGATDLDSAVAAIRLGSLFDRLPGDFRRAPDKAEETGANTATPKTPRSDDWVLGNAFVTEWKYSIYPPQGFQVKALPENRKITVGPALVTEEFATDERGVVHADISFDTVRQRFTVAEEKEMQKKIVELADGPAILVNFELKAEALIRAGKPREAFQIYRDGIASHPDEPMNHLRYAEALLNAGLGAKAREEARRATKLAPTSALAQKELASILEYDEVGRQYQGGSDYAGAEAAFRAAMNLDPSDKSVPGNLGILLEYNRDGERYARGSRMKEAVAAYQTLKPEELRDLGIANNLAFALFYAGEYAEARQNAESLNPVPLAVVISSEAALNGPKAAIDLALKRADNEDTRKTLLKTAGTMLATARLYSQAAELFEAGAAGANASNTIALAAMLRGARRHEDIQAANTPVGLAMRFFGAVTDPDISTAKMMPFVSRNGKVIESLRDPDELADADRVLRQTRRELMGLGFPLDVMIDLTIAAVEPQTEGDDANGYRVSLKAPGSNSVFFVVKEEDQYKLLDSTQEPNSIGLEILDRVAANNLKGAKVLLDWLRDAEHLQGGDDPLSGAIFPRTWTIGQDADAGHVKLAAAAILVGSRPTSRKGLEILEQLAGSLTDAKDKLNCQLALIQGYVYAHDYAKMLPVAADLVRQYPQSIEAFSDQQESLRGLERSQEADALAKERLKSKPDDLDAHRALVSNALARNDYSRARELEAAALHSNKAGPGEQNELAWLSLFTGNVTDADIELATQAARGNQAGNEGILHTLGCLYAEKGKTKEAHEVLIQAMNQLKLAEPNEIFWLAFGLVAEQYGEIDVARDDYAKLKQPKDPLDSPGSSYQLAQMHLKALKQSTSTKAN